ncbi:Zinc finger RING-type [Arabidopsis thaliana x Arabidopsis arenosa]|uniref:RING-type E3 ubiquitin transferase n=1 Tax=Arabidopsis thaliana x Arabidopsis arenosa TaxID=1240361 RepID=A0A8T2BZP5_9BRAS|nr:Zinc finger RING-type [Arabidopsis thaliana x Arabidopsis arenosa]
MATEQEAEVGTETSSVSGRFLRNRDLYLFLPFLLGFSDQESSNGDDDDVASSRERIILVNPFTQGMIVLEGSSGMNPLLRDILESREEGRPPASKASIDAMPIVQIDGCEGECVICLEEWKSDEMVKEMPCKHRFHGGCIEKWLGFHGSCPVCRYEMPVDGDEVGKKRNDGSEIWVRFSFNDGPRIRDSSGQEGGNNDGDGNTIGSSTRPVVESED